MNLVEKLMKADTKAADERATGIYKSHNLARILGETEPVEVSIQEISERRQTELISTAVDEKGNVDMAKSYDANLKVILAGVIDPPLKDKDLQEHFGCKMAIDLAEKLFKAEVGYLASTILELGKVGNMKDDEAEIKN